ncbi:hypothetical protein Taro_033863 [Colocasia esculenta]|uniref:Uncharacterized protein n=1 Tax=Colocasia esculenta TaxID=4460 RepID=A0A843WA75_COLES|nr:hypothetical protein [Colocasia esculenta]
MEQMAAKIGEKYIVQVVTDDDSNNKKAEEELMKLSMSLRQHKTLHAYYLHPGFQHEDEVAYRDDLLGAVTSVVDRMSRNHEKPAAALNELKYFRKGTGSFGDPSAIAS